MRRIEKTKRSVLCFLAVCVCVSAALAGSVEFAWDTYDAGESYWYFDQEISLLRVKGQLVVRLAEGAPEGALDSLTADGAALSGWAKVGPAAQGWQKFSAPDPQHADLDARLAALQSDPTVNWCSPTYVCASTGGRLWATNEVVAGLKPGADPANVLAEGFIGYRRMWGTRDQWIATVPGGGVEALQAADRLRQHPEIAWASPNFCQEAIPAAIHPNDTYFGDQWHLEDTGQTGGPGGADAAVAEAWETTTGDEQVVIAIIDDGIQVAHGSNPEHPDLEANIYQNPLEVNGQPGVDDDGNGYVDDLHGWDFLSNNGDPNGGAHGTVVAGVPAAVGNNDEGIAGVAYNAKILPVRVMRYYFPYTPTTLVAKALYYAGGFGEHGEMAWRGADVINCSWHMSAPSTIISLALKRVAAEGRSYWAGDQPGAAIFAASGNAVSYYKDRRVYIEQEGEYVFRWAFRGTYPAHKGYLANVHFPDGSAARLDTEDCLDGWTISPEGCWTVEWDPVCAHGVSGGWVVHTTAPPPSNGLLDSPPVTVTAPGYLTYCGWVYGYTGCDLKLYGSKDGGEFQELDTVSWEGERQPGYQQGSVPYPASYDSVIAVGASTDWSFRAGYSQFGPNLELVAPSGGGYWDLLTTDITGAGGYGTGDYTWLRGTSLSSPLSAGVAALMLAKNYNLKASTIRSILRDTCDKIGPEEIPYVDGRNDYYGYGRINAAAAVAQVYKGDRDGDGDVDLADFDVVFAGWHHSVLEGHPSDPSRDGYVDEDDYDIVLADWEGDPPDLPDDPPPPEDPKGHRISFRQGGGEGYVDVVFDDTYLEPVPCPMGVGPVGSACNLKVVDGTITGEGDVERVALVAVKELFTELPANDGVDDLTINDAKLILHRYMGPEGAPFSIARMTTDWLFDEAGTNENDCSAMYAKHSEYGPWCDWLTCFGTNDYDGANAVSASLQTTMYHGKQEFDITSLISTIYDVGDNYGLVLVGHPGYSPGGEYYGIGFCSSEFPVTGEPTYHPVLQIDYQYGPDYTLTVNSGTGDGTYPKDLVVEVEADPPPTGLVFKTWAGDTSGIDDARAADTTITMPRSDAEITATYKYRGDVNEDGFVGGTDLDYILADWGHSGTEITDPRADINGDDFVGGTDLDYVLGDWGKGTPPGGGKDGGGDSKEGGGKDSEGLSVQIVAVDNSSVPELADYVTQDVVVSTDTDWLSAQLILQVDVEGDIYQHPYGLEGPRDPVWFELFPAIEFDTYVSDGDGKPANTGAPVDLYGGECSKVFDDELLQIGWYTGEDDQTGELALGRVTLADDATGEWSFVVTASPAEGPKVLVEGDIVDGEIIPDE